MIADRPRPATSTLAEQLATHLASRAAEANEDPALRYEHHAQIERWLGNGPLREADAFLRAAWMHEDCKSPSDALRCRKRAVACYRRGVDERKWFARREDLVVIGYLVGELHRKLGQGDEATRWFEQAIAWSSGLQKMQELVELAERQARDPREVV
jgi:tetratricopeptide (TPR) repeat protein